MIQETDIPVLQRSEKQKRKRESGDTWYYFGLAGEIGFAIAIPIVLGALSGSFIDRHLKSYPTYTVVFLMAGIGISIVNFVATVMKMLKRKP